MIKTVTVNLDESIERKFREKARLKYGNRKGALAKALNEALEEWLKNEEQDQLKEGMTLLEKGIKMKKWGFKREDLYD
jgi:predicted transcriptional regulator